MSCCGDDYGRAFPEAEAARAVAGFERRGLRGTARLTAASIERHVENGGSLLEIGGGPGLIGISLLASGAVARVTTIDLSPSWTEPARDLADRQGVSERVERIVGDVVAMAPQLEGADVVVAHRVVCCYPDWKAMMSAVATLTGRWVTITFPAARWWNRLAVGLTNLVMRLRQVRFRAFVHPPEQMLAELEGAGLRVRADAVGLVWRTVMLERTGSSS